MATDLPLFLQPVEITATNKNLTIGAVSYALTEGVYPTILAVVFELNTQISADSHAAELIYNETTDTFKTVLNLAAVATVTWDDTKLATLLGWDDGTTLTGASTYTADDTPEKVWKPTYVEAQRASFRLAQRKVVKGANTGSGRYVGASSHIDKYEKSFDFVHELASNAMRTHATKEQDIVRCWEYFILDCRRSRPVGENNVQTRGFYYYPDASNADSTDSANNQANMGDGGINFEFVTSPDTYVFCNVLKGKVSDPSYSLSRTKQRVKVGFAAITSVAPNWS